MFKLNKFHPNTQPNLASLESQKIIKNTIPTPPIHLQPNSKQPNNPQFKKQPLIPQNNESITEKLIPPVQTDPVRGYGLSPERLVPGVLGG